MAANNPVPDANRPEVVPAGQVPITPTSSFQQMTNIQSYVPSHVWTTEALFDYHAKQKDVIFDNNRIFDTQKGREHQLSIAGVVLVTAIIIFACYLVAIGNSFGKDILGYTMAFLAGYLAGKGDTKK
jgi:hypothetical protein